MVVSIVKVNYADYLQYCLSVVAIMRSPEWRRIVLSIIGGGCFNTSTLTLCSLVIDYYAVSCRGVWTEVASRCRLPHDPDPDSWKETFEHPHLP